MFRLLYSVWWSRTQVQLVDPPDVMSMSCLGYVWAMFGHVTYGRYNRSILIGILPISTFCSGHTFFVQRMPQQRHVQPFSVHTTYQFSGAVGKTHRLREAKLWDDEAS